MRIAVVSDIHSNIVAFEAVLADAGEIDQLWCLGDIVGYGPRPNEVVARLAGLKHVAVAGNHDHAAIGRIGIEEFNVLARFAAEWTTDEMSPATRAYLDALPTLQIAGEFTLVHGSPRAHVWEYILNATIAEENFSYFSGPYCLVGHTHVPAVFGLSPDGEVRVQQMHDGDQLDLAQPGWRFILNPGSVGQPRDDNPLASYLLIDTDLGAARWCRVAYQIAETQQQMRAAKLPGRLIDRLAAGW